MDEKLEVEPASQYFFRPEALPEENVGGTYSTSRGGVVRGDRIQAGLILKPKGTGSSWHSHPNEQFIYVVQGTLRARVNDEERLVPKGGIIRIPANTMHSIISTPEEDVLFFTAKDMTWSIVGVARDDSAGVASYEKEFGKTG